MKSKLMKVLSLAMALALVASLAACGGNGGDETTIAPEDTTVGEVTPGAGETEAEVPSGEEASTEEVTEIVTDKEGHTQVVEVTQKPGATPNTPATPNAPAAGKSKPSTTADMIKAYNDGLGSMKSAVTRKLNSGKIDAGFLGTMDFGSNAEGQKVVNCTNNGSLKTSAVKLNASDVANATCAGTGNNYTITFTLKNHNNTMDKIKKGDGGYMYFVDLTEAQAMIPGIIKASGVNLNASATIVADKSTISLSGGKYVVTVANGQVTKAVLTCNEKVAAKAKFGPVSPTANIDVNITATYTK